MDFPGGTIYKTAIWLWYNISHTLRTNFSPGYFYKRLLFIFGFGQNIG